MSICVLSSFDGLFSFSSGFSGLLTALGPASSIITTQPKRLTGYCIVAAIGIIFDLLLISME